MSRRFSQTARSTALLHQRTCADERAARLCLESAIETGFLLYSGRVLVRDGKVLGAGLGGLGDGCGLGCGLSGGGGGRVE